MKIYQLAFLLFFALAFGACSSSPSNTAVTVSNTNSTNETKAADQNSPAGETAVSGSPTETLKNFAAATKKKDAEGIKNTLSKSTMKVIEESAKKQNISIDEMLTKAEDPKKKDLPEMRNEKIEGDTATLEVKNDVTGDFDVMPFVKEDGSWKIALDVFMEGMMKKMRDDMKKPTSSSPASKGTGK